MMEEMSKRPASSVPKQREQINVVQVLQPKKPMTRERYGSTNQRISERMLKDKLLLSSSTV
jgi:hypothetical protein